MHLNAQILAALRTFNVAAGATSFTQAGSELHVSAAAVSQQIKHLEQQLSLTLFTRHARGISLTPDGQSLFESVAPSLASIELTIEKLQYNNQKNCAIRVKSTPSFAFKWLVPRLADFYEQHPNIQVQIFADGALVDKKQQDFELAIDFSPMPYPQTGNTLQPQLLMTEFLIPVVSPQYAAKHNWQDPSCWSQVSLLHDAMPWQGASTDVEWRFWFDQMNLSQHFCHNAHYFNRTDLAMEAAIAGQGVALARQALLGNVLEQGVLVAPFAPITTTCGYYLLKNNLTSEAKTQSVIAFTQWIKAQVLST